MGLLFGLVPQTMALFEHHVTWWIARHTHQRWGIVGQGGYGVPVGLDTSTARTRDLPRFGALVVR